MDENKLVSSSKEQDISFFSRSESKLINKLNIKK